MESAIYLRVPKYGFQTFFGRSDVVDILEITVTPASTLLKKLAVLNITEPVSGMGKGTYRYNPAFFN